MNAEWVLWAPNPAEEACHHPGKTEAEDSTDVSQEDSCAEQHIESQKEDVKDQTPLSRFVARLQEVMLRLEATVASGCVMNIDLNGKTTTLKPEFKCKRGVISLTSTRQDQRFNVAPTSCAARIQDSSQENSSSTAQHLNERLRPASFAAAVTIESCEVFARTDQPLIQPEIDIVEVFDTAVVIRLSKLSGARFEVTVYASGTDEALGSASTFVQRGPVRMAESIHRIGQLETSQVYVAWVKVFSDNQSKESKQKGFKTLEAKQKTIWDEKDHVILGVAPDATAKEITRAWRAKSLLFHPDKADEAHKEEAEEMMKRLNLAKVNMLKCATPLREDDSPTGAASPNEASTPHNHDFFGGDDGEVDEDPLSRQFSGNSRSFRQSQGHEVDSDEEESEDDDLEVDSKDGCLRCSLKVDAAKPPVLKITERGYTHLELEASSLPPKCSVEVLKETSDGKWIVATPLAKATGPTMCFTISDLQENTPYRFKLRTVLELEPLRLLFAEFAADDSASEASQETAHSSAGLNLPESNRRPGRSKSKLRPVSEGEEDDEEPSVTPQDGQRWTM